MNIVTREEWGARDPKFIRTLVVPTKDLILHHSASTGGGAARVRAIQRFHMDTRGWRDIAYHYLIDTDGTVYEGRGGGIEGGATFGENQTSHAICFLGNFDSETPTPAAIDSLIELVEWGHERGWWPRRITGGHRDFRSTSCPGDKLYPLIPVINEQIEEEDMTPQEMLATKVRISSDVEIELGLLLSRIYRNNDALIAAHRAGTLGTTAFAEIEDDDLQAIAVAVAEEQARRQAE